MRRFLLNPAVAKAQGIKMREVAHRLLVAIIVLCALGVSQYSAEAQNITAEGAARTASGHAAIVQFCPVYFVINGPQAVAMSAAARELAYKMYPPGKAKAAVDREFQRRFKEVEITGAEHWCRNQREVHKSFDLSNPVFLN